MVKILIVDDESTTLSVTKMGIEELFPDFIVSSAENGEKAVQILNSSSIDIVITDLQMPVMDGFELLTHLRNHFPSISVIAMSGYGTPAIKERLRSLGNLIFIGKPFNFGQLKQAIKEALQQKTKEGAMRGISLIGFVQLIEMEQKTCLLEVHKEGTDEKGFLYFNKGMIYDALLKGIRGEPATLKMLDWEKVIIKIVKLPKKNYKRVIMKGLMALIMEATKNRDESKKEAIVTEQPLDLAQTTSSDHLAENEAVIQLTPEDEYKSEIPDTVEISPLISPEQHTAAPEENINIQTSSVTDDTVIAPLKDMKADFGAIQKPLSDFLQEILELSELKAAIIVDKNGLVIESSGTYSNVDRNTFAAYIGMVLHGATKMGNELNLNQLQTIMLESDDAMIMCTAIGDAFLVLLASDSTKLGIIRLRLKKQLQKLKNIL